MTVYVRYDKMNADRCLPEVPRNIGCTESSAETREKNPSGCLPEVPRNIGCAEEHRRDMDAQKAAVYGLLPELKISVTKRVLAGSQGKTRRHGKYASKSD